MAGAPNPLSGLNLVDAEGNPVSVESMWRSGHAVIGFVRHFG
jgi:hypothetical protein